MRREGNACHKLPKICPPFCTLLRGKSGEWAFARILISSRTYAPPAVPRTIMTTADERHAVSMNMYYRKSAALVLKLSQEASQQLASSVVAGDNPV